MNVVKFNPFRPAMSRNFNFENSNNLFDDFFGNDYSFSAANRIPAANFVELEKEFRIELAAPGLNKQDFKINLDKQVLTIEADVVKADDQPEVNRTRTEFEYSTFKRSFRLGKVLNTDEINAKYENGILTVSIAKREEALEKPAKEIQIS